MRWLDGITDQQNGQGFEQTPGDSEGQGSLACCRPRGCRESDMTEQLKNSSIPLPECTTVSLSIHLIMEAVVASNLSSFEISVFFLLQIFLR